MNVFAHQTAAYSELVKRAETFFAGHWRKLPIKTRWHSLLIGPTGAGKTALATMLADAMDAQLLRISAPSWMPSGAHNRACAETLTVIVDHVSTHPRSLLFLDELEKIHYDTSWNNYVLGEIYDILDGRFPTGVKGGENSTLQVDENGVLTLTQKTTLIEKLLSSTFIIAAATFQDFFEQRSKRSIGFNDDNGTQVSSQSPTSETLMRKLPRELVNRFNSHHVMLPELSPEHYQLIAEESEKSLPPWIQLAFREAARQRIQRAVEARSGCRFVEEALAEALKATKAPEPVLPDEPDLEDW